MKSIKESKSSRNKDTLSKIHQHKLEVADVPSRLQRKREAIIQLQAVFIFYKLSFSFSSY